MQAKLTVELTHDKTPHSCFRYTLESKNSRVNGFHLVSPSITEVKPSRKSLIPLGSVSKQYWIEVHLFIHPLCPLQLKVCFLERQLVPSSACHSPSTLQATVLSPVRLPVSTCSSSRREMWLWNAVVSLISRCQRYVKWKHTEPFRFLSKCFSHIYSKSCERC